MNYINFEEYVRRANPQDTVPDYDPAFLEAMVAEHGSPLLLLDCEVIRQQYRQLQRALGEEVALHYAIKPLPHPAVVATLRDEGACFDLATAGEVELVRAAGIEPERCIHTHPIKFDREIRAALDYGCTTFVVDNPLEVEKFLPYRDRAELLIRVSFRSSDAIVDLSRKFGCHPDDVPALLDQAANAGIRVKGFSFHVGSQTLNPRKYVEAIERCRDLIDAAEQAGHHLTVLDIGGGYPVSYTESVMPIEDYCRPIRAALARLPEYVRVIAEPGRFISAPAITAVASVMGKAWRGDQVWYYLDDGVYGSYSGQIFDHATYPVDALRQDGPRRSSVLAGPTCDSIDVIREDIDLPDLDVGDLVIGRMMGAYTWASATEFNFFRKASIVVLDSAASAAAERRHAAAR